MKKILALDLATKTGFCTGKIPGLKDELSGTKIFDVKRGESPGMRFLRLNSWLSEMFVLMGGIDIIVYEQAHHRGGPATQCAVGMATHVMSFAAEHDIETMSVHTGTLKKYATGAGNAGKGQVMAAAQRLGYNPEDDNEADAIFLWRYAIDSLTL